MFKLIDTADVKEYLASVMGVDTVAVDTETWFNPLREDAIIRFIKDSRGINKPNNEPFIVSMSTDSNGGVVIEVNTHTIPLLQEFFSRPRTVIFFNANFDLHMLHNVGIKPQGKFVDVMVLHQLVNEEDTYNGKPLFGLDNIARKYRKSDADKYAKEVLDVRKQLATANNCSYHDIDYYQVYKARPDIMIPYAASDTRDTFFLYEHFMPSIYAEKLERVFQTEMDLIPVIFGIERNGYGVVSENVRRAEVRLEQELEDTVTQIYSVAGGEINPNSANDLVSVYHKLGYNYDRMTEKGNYVTDADTIQTLTHHEIPEVREFSELIVKYRRISKLLNTFISEIKEYNQNGSIHCSFWQSGARTGRMSSSNPNLQNIDRKDDTIRSCFGPRPGYINVHMDYSQQEYRLLAHHADETTLIEAINNGYDVHRATASLIFEKPYEAITEPERDRAKQINFALVYGLGNAAFASNLGHQVDSQTYNDGLRIVCALGYKPWALPTPGSVEKQLRALGKTDIEIRKAMYIYRPEVMEGISHAQQLKRTYFSRLPNIQRFIYDCREYTKEFGYIRNWIGRKKRYNNPQQEAYKSVNALIQGGCAYILKTKLLEVAKFLEGKKSRIVNLIHDEIVFEIALDELHIIPQLQDILTVRDFKTLIDCDIQYTYTNWAELHDFNTLEEIEEAIGAWKQNQSGGEVHDEASN